MEAGHEMTGVFGVLIVALFLFIWGRLRYDIVALGALLVLTLIRIIAADRAFMGFAHPAVMTVIAVFVLSRGLLNAGVVDSIDRVPFSLQSGTSPIPWSWNRGDTGLEIYWRMGLPLSVVVIIISLPLILWF